MRPSLTTFVGAMVLLVAPAPAQAPPSSPWELLRAQNDRDRDGRISRDEYTRGNVSFRRLDQDGDGFLTPADLEALARVDVRKRRRTASLLARGLGIAAEDQVTKESLREWVRRADANGDGTLALDELSRLPENRRETALTEADGNDDGELSTAELEASLFAADLDGNGVLTARELGIEGGEGEAPRARGAERAPAAGDPAPDFRLPAKDGKQQITLSSYFGKKPVALIFGSFT